MDPRARRLAYLLIVAVAVFSLGGCANPLAELSVDGSLIDPNYGFSPDWLDDETILAVTGTDLTIVEVSAARGKVKRQTPVEITGAVNAFHTNVSPDRAEAVFGVGYAEGTNASDIVVLDLDTRTFTNVTNGAGNYHGPSYLSNDEIIYFDFDYSVASQVTNRVVKHDLTTDAATILIENTWPDDGNGNPVGLAFSWGKAGPANGKILATVTDHSVSGDVSFAILDAVSGAVLLNGLDEGYVWDRVSSGDWLDADTVVITAGSTGNHNYYVYDVSVAGGSHTRTVELTDERIGEVHGANLSPDGTMIASHFVEFDSVGAFVSNWNIVTRIAAPPAE